MKKVFLLLLFCQVASSAEHSLTVFFTGSYGVPNFPEFVGVVMVNDTEVIYCDSNMERAQLKQDWMKKITDDDPEHLQWYTDECHVGHGFFKFTISTVMLHFKQTEGIHTLQNMFGCEWNDETEEVKGFSQFGYDGEDFMSLDLQKQEWRNATPLAFITKQKWDSDKVKINESVNHLTQRCPKWLKKYLSSGKSSLLRTDLPSVSLLWKSPSSPLSCHATGFYPDRAMMFWRKDGEEVHENVSHREILPNHDGTFQTSVELNLSSVITGNWMKYKCVFQLSGVNNDIVTSLDIAAIKTNWGHIAGWVIGALLLLILLAGCIAGLRKHRRRLFIWINNGCLWCHNYLNE